MKIMPNGQSAFIDYLKINGWLKAEPTKDQIVDRLDPDKVRGELVLALGNMPLFMAEVAKNVVIFPLRNARGGISLTLDQLQQKIGAPVCYKVTRGPLPFVPFPTEIPSTEG